MRIIAGRFRGRRLQAPKGTTTRPTTDRVRESLFSTLSSMLGGDFDSATVLDAFAGSGALGLEALSRGASSVTAVEQHRGSHSVLRANIDALDAADEVHSVHGDVFALVTRGALAGPYSLLLLDPPYTLGIERTAGLLEQLAVQGAITTDAVIAWEHAAKVPVVWPEGFEHVSDKKYGDTGISFAVYRGGLAQA